MIQVMSFEQMRAQRTAVVREQTPSARILLAASLSQQLSSLAPTHRSAMPDDLLSRYLRFVAALEAAKVHYILIGGYAVAYHGHLRGTDDFDVWAEPTAENYTRLLAAAEAYGESVSDLRGYDYTRPLNFHLGGDHLYIDVINHIAGVSFAEAWPRAIRAELQGQPTWVISLDDLITAKRAAGRLQDQADIEGLTGAR
jgi:hypothetical protein